MHRVKALVHVCTIPGAYEPPEGTTKAFGSSLAL